MSYDPYPPQPDPDRPVQEYGHPAPQAPRRPWWPWAALAAAVLLLASGTWYAYEYRIKKDSGIAACEAFRDQGKVAGASAESPTGDKLTEAEYRKLRKVFEDSRHDDIREKGTKLMDVLWQVTQLGDNPGLEALPFVGQMMDAVSDMQTACANHGVIVVFDMGGASPSDSPDVKAKCSDVFRSGELIDEVKASAGCSDGDGDPGAIGDFPCADGTHLFSATDVPGVTNGWGWGGQQYRATGNPADDPAYQKAMARCYP